MLKIELPDFTVEYFLEGLNYNHVLDTGDTPMGRVGLHLVESGAGMRFVINNKSLLYDTLSYVIHLNLKKINNELHKILVGERIGKIYFDAGCGYYTQTLTVRTEGDLIIFDTDESLDVSKEAHPLRDKIKNEQVNLIQAVKEVIRVVREYHEICRKTAEIAVPNEVEKFMDILFKEKSVADEYWLPLEEAWFEYRAKHNITDEDVKRALSEAKEEEKIEQEKFKKPWWKIF